MFIKPDDLHLYKSAKFIDVRDPNEYAKGHLHNAVNAYDLFTYLLPTSTKDDIDQMKTYFKKRFGELGISGKEHVIIYEKSMNTQYGASCRGFFILKYMKHPNVSTLEGGLDALIRIESGEQQITKEPSTIITCEYSGQDSPESIYQMVDRDEVVGCARCC
jgi:thiosulfate/3-mercaptopyruvate sulfurtransferase